MSYEQSLEMRSEVAAVDLSAKQFYAVTVQADGLHLAATGKAINGIQQGKAASGAVASFAIRGRTKAAITASTVIAKGAQLEVDSGGTLIPLNSGVAVAQAMEALASTASVCAIAVELLPANGLFA